MKSPVIIEHQMPWAQKMTILTLLGLLLFTSGFVFGIYASMQPIPIYDVTINLQLPAPMEYSREVKPIEVGDRTYRWTYTDLEAEAKCLADNIYFEGRNQTTKGQIAIALATLNRVESKYYPDSICGVVWQQAKDKRSGKKTAQFSWTLDGKSDRIKNKQAYAPIVQLADAMIAEGTLDNFTDFTEGATHYHADYVDPYWSSSLNMVAYIDDHKFYRQ